MMGRSRARWDVFLGGRNSTCSNLLVVNPPSEKRLVQLRCCSFWRQLRHKATAYLLEMIRPTPGDVKPRIVDVYVKKIRRKIEVDEENPKYLRTVRGMGYCFHLPDMPTALLKR
jgi:hypothetical protein